MSDLALLIVDRPASGGWNMAVDEALLEYAAQQQQVVLRFYRWQQATLSLGYFQRYEDRTAHPASRSVEVVRRQSGGGAILHDNELTYSIAIPTAHRLAADTQSLYDALHHTLIAELTTCGVAASLHPSPSKTAPAEEPFLCFQRRALGDVLCGQYKIGGSAQRRRGPAILQHGSVLFSQSEFAPELPGITELADIELSFHPLAEGWAARLQEHLSLTYQCSDLPECCTARADEILAEKYGCAKWTRRR